MKRKIRHLSRILLLLLSLAVLVSGLQSPVSADLSSDFVAYKPKDYISSTVIVGDIKTVQYSFSDFKAYYLTENNGVQKTFTGVSYSHKPAAGSTRSDINVYPLNKRPSLTYALTENTIDVRDLVPGAIVEFSMSLSYTLEYWSESANSYTARMRSCVCCYDEHGNYMSQVVSEWESRNVVISELGASSTFVVSSSVALPVGTCYISPYLNTSLVYNPWPGGDNAIDIYSDRILITTDINMIEDSSETMHAVKDSLDDISDKMDGVSDKLDDVTGELGDIESGIGDVSDKMDDVSDKLDEIISGGEPGEELGGAGESLGDASDIGSGAADDLSDEIGDVSDYESGLMDDVSSAMDEIDISGVGSFAFSLKFISKYVQSIFGDLGDWQIAITLPMFLGLFFGICQHVGGITAMRARHAAARARASRGG